MGVNAVASDGQLVVRLTSPQAGNAYQPGEPTTYSLSGYVMSGAQRDDLDFRSCGEGCFVSPYVWSDGEHVMSFRADASGWRGGPFSSLLTWPAAPAGELIKRVVRVMSGVEAMTLYETGTSDGESDLTAPYRIRISGADYLDSEPFGSGVAPVAVSAPSPGKTTRLLLGFPSAGIFVDLTLDERGRITDETLVSPKHLFRRRFA